MEYARVRTVHTTYVVYTSRRSLSWLPSFFSLFLFVASCDVRAPVLHRVKITRCSARISRPMGCANFARAQHPGEEHDRRRSSSSSSSDRDEANKHESGRVVSLLRNLRTCGAAGAGDVCAPSTPAGVRRNSSTRGASPWTVTDTSRRGKHKNNALRIPFPKDITLFILVANSIPSRNSPDGNVTFRNKVMFFSHDDATYVHM